LKLNENALTCRCVQCYSHARTRYGFMTAMIRRLRRLVQLHAVQKPWCSFD